MIKNKITENILTVQKANEEGKIVLGTDKKKTYNHQQVQAANCLASMLGYHHSTNKVMVLLKWRKH